MMNATEIGKLKSFCAKCVSLTVKNDEGVHVSADGFCRIYAGKTRARRGKAIVSGIEYTTDGDAAELQKRLMSETDQVGDAGKIWIEALLSGRAVEGPVATVTLINEADEDPYTAEPETDGTALAKMADALVRQSGMAFQFAERAQDARFALPEEVTNMAHMIGGYQASQIAAEKYNGQAQLASVLSDLGTQLAPAALIFAQGYAAERSRQRPQQPTPDADSEGQANTSNPPEPSAVDSMEAAAAKLAAAALRGDVTAEDKARLAALFKQAQAFVGE